jgi:Protein of unknown function (DUF3313)
MTYGNATECRPADAGWRKARRLSCLALALIAVAAGCTKEQVVGGGTTQVAGAVPVDGFLPHPERLVPGGSGRADLVYFKPGVNLANYNAILLDPVAIVSDSASPLATASPEQRETVANLYYSDLYAALSRHCHMITTPAPGTLRLTIALTDVRLSNSVVKTLANYTPYVMAVYKVGSTAFNGGAGYFSGTATSEGYITDAVTGDLLWQGVDKRAGATSVVQNTWNSWNDVDNALKGWSDFAVKRMQALGICQR